MTAVLLPVVHRLVGSLVLAAAVVLGVRASSVQLIRDPTDHPLKEVLSSLFEECGR